MKMGSFGVSTQVQLRVGNHGEPPGNPHTAREGGRFYKRGETEVGGLREIKGPLLFVGWVVVGKEEESSFFLAGSAVITGRESAPFWSPNSI